MFKDIAEIQPEKQAVLDSIMKWEFQRCLQQWERQWVQRKGSEMDNTNV
jgi:hypothetical protein